MKLVDKCQSILVGAALICIVASAQTPNAPTIIGDDVALPVSGSAKIIYSENHDSELLGGVSLVANEWARGITPPATLTIEDASPVIGSSRYMVARGTKDGEKVYRTERTSHAVPGLRPMTSLDGGHWVAPETYWYGYWFCLDEYTGTLGERVHFNQWHETGDGPHNPLLSLIGNAKELAAYMEQTDDDGNVYSPVLYTTHLGKCIQVIWQIKWDSRPAAQGTTGLVRLWLGSSQTPKWERINKTVGHKTATGGNQDLPYFKYGGYLSSWRWNGVDGQRYTARYDNYVVMDSTGSWAAMMAALGSAN